MKLVKLGEVCKFFNGKAHEKKIDTDGKFVVVNSKCISSNFEIQKFSNEQLFPLFKNDIVMVMSDVPNGKALAKCRLIEEDKKYSLNQRIACIRSDNFYIPYLLYQLDRNPYFLKFDNGENQTNLRKDDILNCPLYLPSIEEQQRIVAKLDTAFAEIDKEINASKNKQKIVDSLKKNILAKKFELDSDVIKLGDLCEVITKGTTPTSLGYKFIDKGINFIKIESITNIGNFIKSKFAYINKDCNAALKRSQLQAGDILFSIAGALGRTAIVTEEILPANTNQALAILRIKKDIKIDKKFLLHCLNSDVVKKQSDTFKGGTAQQNLSLSQLKSYNIPLPSLVKQKDIVTKLDLIFTEIHKLKKLIEMKIKNYQTLSYAILKKELQKETA
jgi:type I restriction enzyme S subunit